MKFQRCNSCMTVQDENNTECEKCKRDDCLMYPFETTKHADLGFKDMPIRFFIYEQDEESGDHEITETNEAGFLEAEGVIEYERHTVFANGCKQICLTKNPFGGC